MACADWRLIWSRMLYACMRSQPHFGIADRWPPLSAQLPHTPRHTTSPHSRPTLLEARHTPRQDPTGRGWVGCGPASLLQPLGGAGRKRGRLEARGVRGRAPPPGPALPARARAGPPTPPSTATRFEGVPSPLLAPPPQRVPPGGLVSAATPLSARPSSPTPLPACCATPCPLIRPAHACARTRGRHRQPSLPPADDCQRGCRLHPGRHPDRPLLPSFPAPLPPPPPATTRLTTTAPPPLSTISQSGRRDCADISFAADYAPTHPPLTGLLRGHACSTSFCSSASVVAVKCARLRTRWCPQPSALRTGCAAAVLLPPCCRVLPGCAVPPAATEPPAATGLEDHHFRGGLVAACRLLAVDSPPVPSLPPPSHLGPVALTWALCSPVALSPAIMAGDSGSGRAMAQVS